MKPKLFATEREAYAALSMLAKPGQNHVFETPHGYAIGQIKLLVPEPPKTDWIAASLRAKRKAWAKLNQGNPRAKVLPSDPKVEAFKRITKRLHSGYLRAIDRRHARELRFKTRAEAEAARRRLPNSERYLVIETVQGWGLDKVRGYGIVKMR